MSDAMSGITWCSVCAVPYPSHEAHEHKFEILELLKAEREAGRLAGRAEVLREVVERIGAVRTPVRTMAGSQNAGWATCDWCFFQWPEGEPHPDNGCLWPRALAASTPAPEEI